MEIYQEGALCPPYARFYSSGFSLLQKPVNVRVKYYYSAIYRHLAAYSLSLTFAPACLHYDLTALAASLACCEVNPEK